MHAYYTRNVASWHKFMACVTFSWNKYHSNVLCINNNSTWLVCAKKVTDIPHKHIHRHREKAFSVNDVGPSTIEYIFVKPLSGRVKEGVLCAYINVCGIRLIASSVYLRFFVYFKYPWTVLYNMFHVSQGMAINRCSTHHKPPLIAFHCHPTIRKERTYCVYSR